MRLAALAVLRKSLNRAGMQLEIQGCDSDCDYVCGECDWELCTVNADHGGTCDVRILLDDSICEAVPSRFLRMLVTQRNR